MKIVPNNNQNAENYNNELRLQAAFVSDDSGTTL